MDLMGELLADLRAETDSLETLLAPLSPGQWELPTPADGWAVRDQVAHLAWFDEAARTAVTDPAAFRASLEGFAVEAGTVDELAFRSRGMPAAELHAWFRDARARSLEAFAGLGARDRVPWYGPDMSAASFVTARLMETWAHGEDVAAALGVTREPSARLRHVATLGVRARPYGFAVRGLPLPAEPVRVELTPPGGGEPWIAGPQDAADVVRGPMLDFCLLVTRRIHLADTALEITGPAARAWAEVAQAFAGPPGRGRPPRSG
ncbi:TIGR03084 family metal-binding protein [Nonomuraea sp. NPDC050691]|uniref:TIGR03084 family metal-binding protein n=1 Tax=Nonomuraea sp. NPDC050691 TaxID=3155661 RepID=UPI0033FE298C